MRYLLDTHAILWYVDAADELPIKLRDMIDASECLYSVASLWEIAIGEYAELCRKSGFQRLSIIPAHLDRIKELPAIHRDPFDRLLVAQAIEEDLTIVTCDRMIPQYPVRTIW